MISINKIQYFVSYHANDGDAPSRIGRCRVECDEPITSIERIASIEAEIAKGGGFSNVAIINWQRFE